MIYFSLEKNNGQPYYHKNMCAPDLLWEQSLSLCCGDRKFIFLFFILLFFPPHGPRGLGTCQRQQFQLPIYHE
jgi:hypothetical protein